MVKLARKRSRKATPVRRRRPPRLPPELLDDWDDAMERLTAELAGRPRPVRPRPAPQDGVKKERSPSPFDSRSGRLRRFVYGLVRRYKAENLTSVIYPLGRLRLGEPNWLQHGQNLLRADVGDG